eukprot:Clim_evm117s134 gene=Clim_evmTU117s134
MRLSLARLREVVDEGTVRDSHSILHNGGSLADKDKFTDVEEEVVATYKKILRTLSLNHHRFTAFMSFQSFTKLEVLHLQFNQLRSLKGIGSLTKLRECLVGGNKIKSVPIELGRLQKLENLGLENNQLLDDLPTVATVLKSCLALKTLSMKRNPCMEGRAGMAVSSKRDYLIWMLRTVTNLDGEPVTEEQRQTADKTYRHADPSQASRKVMNSLETENQNLKAQIDDALDKTSSKEMQLTALRAKVSEYEARLKEEQNRVKVLKQQLSSEHTALTDAIDRIAVLEEVRITGETIRSAQEFARESTPIPGKTEWQESRELFCTRIVEPLLTAAEYACACIPSARLVSTGLRDKLSLPQTDLHQAFDFLPPLPSFENNLTTLDDALKETGQLSAWLCDAMLRHNRVFQELHTEVVSADIVTPGHGAANERQIEHLNQQMNTATNEMDKLSSENEQLVRETETLRRVNLQYRGQIEALEKVVLVRKGDPIPNPSRTRTCGVQVMDNREELETSMMQPEDKRNVALTRRWTNVAREAEERAQTCRSEVARLEEVLRARHQELAELEGSMRNLESSAAKATESFDTYSQHMQKLEEDIRGQEGQLESMRTNEAVLQRSINTLQQSQRDCMDQATQAAELLHRVHSAIHHLSARDPRTFRCQCGLRENDGPLEIPIVSVARCLHGNLTTCRSALEEFTAKEATAKDSIERLESVLALKTQQRDSLEAEMGRLTQAVRKQESKYHRIEDKVQKEYNLHQKMQRVLQETTRTLANSPVSAGKPSRSRTQPSLALEDLDGNDDSDAENITGSNIRNEGFDAILEEADRVLSRSLSRQQY